MATGRVRDAFEPLDRALELAQALDLPDVLAGALTFKAQLCNAVGRVHEARIQFDAALELCQQHELTDRLLLAQLNSGDFRRRFDLPGAAEQTRDALATARRIGSRLFESVAASNLMRVWEYSGDWDELESLGAELLAGSGDRPGAEYLHLELGIVAALRGQAGTAREHLAGLASWQRSDMGELRWTYAACEATIAVAAGEFADALELLSATMREIAEIEGPASQASRIGFPQAIAAAVTLGRLTEADELLSLFADEPPGHVPAYVRAHIARGRGLLAAARDETATAEAQLRTAIEGLTALGIRTGSRSFRPIWPTCSSPIGDPPKPRRCSTRRVRSSRGSARHWPWSGSIASSPGCRSRPLRETRALQIRCNR